MNDAAREIAKRNLLPSKEESTETSREVKLWWRHVVEKLKRGIKSCDSLRRVNIAAKRRSVQ